MKEKNLFYFLPLNIDENAKKGAQIIKFIPIPPVYQTLSGLHCAMF